MDCIEIYHDGGVSVPARNQEFVHEDRCGNHHCVFDRRPCCDVTK